MVRRAPRICAATRATRRSAPLSLGLLMTKSVLSSLKKHTKTRENRTKKSKKTACALRAHRHAPTQDFLLLIIDLKRFHGRSVIFCS